MNLAPYDGLTPIQIFRKIAFELKVFPDDVVQAQIDLAGAMFCSKAYGPAENLFLALMAAHLMTIPGGIAASQGTGGGGPNGVKTLREGDLTITYADAASTDNASLKAWLGGSRFGELLLMLRRTMGFGFGLTAVGPGLFCDDD